MMTHVYGFDWTIYAKTLMPAFARWLISDEEQEIYQLYSNTLYAQEEHFVPESMQPLCAWPRARDFVHRLPRGPFAQREYQKLCVAEQFLRLSDRYVYRHPPQLHSESAALRTIWAATIQHYCLPWQQHSQESQKAYSIEPITIEPITAHNDVPTARNELLDLLQMAGLNKLAEEISEYLSTREEAKSAQELTTIPEEPAAPAGEHAEDGRSNAPRGVFIGRHPTTLHLRGWLGAQSMRAMALFEYLVCGRRRMPFGYQESDPVGAYIGYLTPQEVSALFKSLQHAHIPDRQEAEADYAAFRLQRNQDDAPFRLIDEVLPVYASAFCQATRSAAEQALGLICAHTA